MRDHLAADLAEAAEPVCDCEKAVFIHHGDVTDVVPAVTQNFSGLLWTTQISQHHIRSADFDHSTLTDRLNHACFRMHHAHTDSRQWMSDFAAFKSNLAESR